MKLLSILCLIMMVMISSTKASYVFLNGSFTPIYIKTPYLHGISAKLPFNLTTYLIPLGRDAKGMQNCTGPDPSLAPFMRGALVMVVPDGGCSIPQHALVAQKAGASAVLILTGGTWLFSKLQHERPGPEVIKIPTILIELKDFTSILAPTFGSGGQIIFKIEANPSKMDDLKRGGIIFYQTFLEILTLAGMGLMVFKITDYFRKKNDFSVSILVFISTLITLIANCLYVLDPWAYWDAIPYFSYLIMNLNIGDLFLTISILLVTFHLSHLLFETTRYSKLVWIPYVVSSLLMAGYLTSILVDLSHQLSYSYGKITPNSSQSFRTAVFCLIALYYFICNIVFLRRLLPMFSLQSGTQDKKKSQYIRLISVTFGILFLVIILIILHGLVLHSPYMGSPVAMLSINGCQVAIAPLFALCYFFLFKTRDTKKKTSSNSTEKKSDSDKNANYKKFETE